MGKLHRGVAVPFYTHSARNRSPRQTFWLAGSIAHCADMTDNLESMRDRELDCTGGSRPGETQTSPAVDQSLRMCPLPPGTRSPRNVTQLAPNASAVSDAPHSQCAGRLGAAGRVRYSGLKGAARGERRLCLFNRAGVRREARGTAS